MIIHDDGVGGYRPAPWAWEPLKQYKYYVCRLQIFGYKEYKRYIHLDIFNQSTPWSLFMQTLNHGLFIIPAYEPQHTLPPQSPVLAKRSNPMNIWCCISVFAEDARNYWIFDADAGAGEDARQRCSHVVVLGPVNLGNLCTQYSCYDNEYGYCARVTDSRVKTRPAAALLTYRVIHKPGQHSAIYHGNIWN